MDQIQKSRLFPFIGFLLTSWFCHGQDDRFLPDVEGYRIDRESYVMIWDSVLRLPKVTAYEVTREELERFDCGGARYHADPDLNEFPATHYKGAADLGFQRTSDSSFTGQLERYLLFAYLLLLEYCASARIHQ